jgi:hypothetical protein
MKSCIAGFVAGLSCIASIGSAAAELPQPVTAQLAPEIAKRLSADPALAAAPPVARKSFGYAYSYEWKDPKDPFRSDTNVSYEVLPQPGFVLERKVYKEDDGYTTTGESFYAAGGLLQLIDTIEVTQPDGTKRKRENRLTDYDISGELYPVAKGNSFEIETKLGDWELEHDCEVERELKAAEFDSGLSGPAFYVVCEVDMTGQQTGVQDYYYIQELNHFVPDFRASVCAECRGFDLKAE